MMNYPPWATADTQNAAVRNQAAPIPPYLQYYLGNQQRLGAFRPPALGNQLASVQQYNRGTPSEQAGYEGYLSDQLGLHPADVGWLMQRLAPQGYTSRPRWASGQ